MTGAQRSVKRRALLISLTVLSCILSACLSTPPPATKSAPTATPLVVSTATATHLPAPPTTPAPRLTTTPAHATLAVPTAFASAYAGQMAQLQQAQPGLRIEKVADSAAAATRLQKRQAAWAVIESTQPITAARLLCSTPYVPVVHFSSPLEDVSMQRLQAIYQGKDWQGQVFYSGDTAMLRRLLDIQALGSQARALASWKEVIERVAGDRTALAYVPWAEVDARVKTLSLDGRSIAVNGIQGYGYGGGWWLVAGSNVSMATGDAIARSLACPISEPVTFLAGGDILMGWYVHDLYIKQHGPEYLFRRIRDLIRSADIAFANVENPLTTHEVSGYLKFRAAPEAAKGLTYAGIDVVNLANNHIGDAGTQGLLNTIDTLRQNGITYVGVGRNRAEARSSWITTTKGIKVAILAYNDIGIEPGYFAATDARPGMAWIEPDNVYAEIKRAKAQADFVIVSFHWGVEYTPHPTSRQRGIARRAAEAGAGMIIGHHPHVVQGVGFFGPVFVNYSIGDFVYSQPTRPTTGEGIILRAVIEKQALKQVQMIPIYIDRAQPYVISPVEAKLMMARIFDATRLYNGLPPSKEQPAPSFAAVVLPQGKSRLPAGSVASVALRGAQTDIVATGAQGTTMKLTTTGALNDAPVWSPDGTRLAYSSAKDGSVDIFVAAGDGAGAVNVTRHPAWDDYPTWSPDGSKIAFSSNRDGAFKVYVMNADGTGLRRLTDGPSWDTTPAWSPDGKRIAFASDRSGDVFQIFTVAVDGSDLRQLTRHIRSCAFPSWSPDGTKVVYQSYEDESFTHSDDSIQDRDYEIMVIPSAGGQARRLTDNRFADIQPVWSPDGRRIAFASDSSGVFQIYAMNADGSGVAAVTGGPDAHVAPAWVP